MKKELDKIGIKDIKAKAPAEYSSIKRLLQSDRINSDYNDAGSPTIGDGRQMSISSDYNGPRTADGSSAMAETKIFGNGDIIMYGSSFESWETLGYNMIHEFSHRYHYIHGMITSWSSIKGITQDEVLKISEYYSWGRNAYWGQEYFLGMFSRWDEVRDKYHLSNKAWQ